MIFFKAKNSPQSTIRVLNLTQSNFLCWLNIMYLNKTSLFLLSMSAIQTSIQTFIQEIKRTYLKKGGRPGKTPQR